MLRPPLPPTAPQCPRRRPLSWDGAPATAWGQAPCGAGRAVAPSPTSAAALGGGPAPCRPALAWPSSGSSCQALPPMPFPCSQHVPCLPRTCMQPSLGGRGASAAGGAGRGRFPSSPHMVSSDAWSLRGLPISAGAPMGGASAPPWGQDEAHPSQMPCSAQPTEAEAGLWACSPPARLWPRVPGMCPGLAVAAFLLTFRALRLISFGLLTF